MASDENGDSEQCQHCERVASWTWWCGKGGGGKYCDLHAREKLPDESRIALYKDPITTAEMQKRQRHGPVVDTGGGVRPLGGGYPIVRTKQALDRWTAYEKLQSDEDSV